MARKFHMTRSSDDEKRDECTKKPLRSIRKKKKSKHIDRMRSRSVSTRNSHNNKSQHRTTTATPHFNFHQPKLGDNASFNTITGNQRDVDLLHTAGHDLHQNDHRQIHSSPRREDPQSDTASAAEKSDVDMEEASEDDEGDYPESDGSNDEDTIKHEDE